MGIILYLLSTSIRRSFLFAQFIAVMQTEKTKLEKKNFLVEKKCCYSFSTVMSCERCIGNKHSILSARQKSGGKGERKGLQDSDENCYVVQFGDRDTDKRHKKEWEVDGNEDVEVFLRSKDG